MSLLLKESGSKWALAIAALAGFAEGVVAIVALKAGFAQAAAVVRGGALCWMFVRGPRSLMGSGEDFVRVANLAWATMAFVVLGGVVGWLATAT